MSQNKNIIVHQQTAMALKCYCTVQMNYQKLQDMEQPLQMAMKHESLLILLYLNHRIPFEEFQRKFDNVCLKMKIHSNFTSNAKLIFSQLLQVMIFLIFPSFSELIPDG